MSTTTTTPAAPAQTELQIIEGKVSAFVTNVINEVEILVADAIQGLEDVAALVPQASAWIESAASFIEGIPVVGQNPTVLATIAAVDLADKGLDAFAATLNQAQTAGSSVTVTQATQAIVSGYQAYNAAKVANGNIVSAALTAAPATAAAATAAPSGS
jgi:hypothetical protein